jgi:hypothetical protein
MPIFDKIKHSGHQREQIPGAPGHDCTEAEAESIIASPLATSVQEDGRFRYWGLVRGKIYRLAVSLSYSLSTTLDFITVGRVVTAHRHRLPKK